MNGFTPYKIGKYRMFRSCPFEYESARNYKIRFHAFELIKNNFSKMCEDEQHDFILCIEDNMVDFLYERYAWMREYEAYMEDCECIATPDYVGPRYGAFSGYYPIIYDKEIDILHEII